MSIFEEVRDGLSYIAATIGDIKDITAAVRDGKAYLDAKHPEVKPPLLAVMEELRKTTAAIARASAVLTHFRFEADKAGEAARFDAHAIELKGEAADLGAQIDTLRGHCSVIRGAADDIVSRTVKGGGIRALFAIFGLASPAREAELGVKLDKLAFEEHETLNAAVRMVEYLTKAIRDVLDTLGSRGMMQPAQIPVAAALLADYADEFEKLEAPAKKASAELAQLAFDLQQ